MGKITGFLEFERNDRDYEPVEARVKHWREFVLPLPEEENRKQAARCMDCGIPYCHIHGCPLHNRIPEFNDLVHRRQWRKALALLQATNSFPEITGRICPGLCEAACSLAINQSAVTIRQVELHLVERGWAEGWIKPEPASFKTGRKVAVVGSGPAGLVAAQHLAAPCAGEQAIFDR